MAEKVQALIEVANEESAAAEALLEPPSPYSRSPLGARGTATQVHAWPHALLVWSAADGTHHALQWDLLADWNALQADSACRAYAGGDSWGHTGRHDSEARVFAPCLKSSKIPVSRYMCAKQHAECMYC